MEIDKDARLGRQPGQDLRHHRELQTTLVRFVFMLETSADRPHDTPYARPFATPLLELTRSAEPYPQFKSLNVLHLVLTSWSRRFVLELKSILFPAAMIRPLILPSYRLVTHVHGQYKSSASDLYDFV